MSAYPLQHLYTLQAIFETASVSSRISLPNCSSERYYCINSRAGFIQYLRQLSVTVAVVSVFGDCFKLSMKAGRQAGERDRWMDGWMEVEREREGRQAGR